MNGKTNVAVASELSRYATVKKALELIEDDIAVEIKGKKRIVIKPNFVNVFVRLACTPATTVRAVLDVITKHTDQPVTIAEGSATSTWIGFTRFGYPLLLRDYKVRFVNLNQDKARPVEIYDSDMNIVTVPVAETVLDSDFLISAALMKTHDTVLATLGLKNVLVGAIRRAGQKGRIHQGYRAINMTLAKMAAVFHPHLAVIDGWRAMEGNGPSSGTPVDMKTAVASTDFLAADIIAANLMGFEPEEIGYLWRLCQTGPGEGNLERIEVAGEDIDRLKRDFKRHRNWRHQLNWR